MSRTRKERRTKDSLTHDEWHDLQWAISAAALLGQDWVAWPSYVPAVYNACTDACDAVLGPCACGAWHKAEDWKCP